MEKITQRGQARPADWPKAVSPLVQCDSDISTPKSEWKWRKLAKLQDLIPNAGGTTYDLHQVYNRTASDSNIH